MSLSQKDLVLERLPPRDVFDINNYLLSLSGKHRQGELA